MSDDVTKTILGGEDFAAALRASQPGLGEETSAMDLAVDLQDQVRIKQHRIEELERLVRELRELHLTELEQKDEDCERTVLRFKYRIDALEVDLTVERRERARLRELFEKVLKTFDEGVDVWAHDLTHVISNGGALHILMLTDRDLDADTLRELAEQIGPVYDWEGHELPPRSWPLARALRGEVVRGAELMVNGVKILVDAHPLTLTGEAQLWAVVRYRRAP
jgi:hypothetical protein